MANLKSEQIRSDLSLDISLDQPLSKKEMNNVLVTCLGQNKCSMVDNYLCFDNRIIFLVKAVTYLGGNGQHPLFKKRIQLPSEWKTFVKRHANYDVRFLGVYHFEGNVIFVDFDKSTYIQRKMHNSSAFVYTNDLYQGMQDGVFERTDVHGNTRSTIRYKKFKEYIEGKVQRNASIITPIDVFDKFNKNYFIFNETIGIVDALRTMHKTRDMNSIRQTEWPGWYLENRVYHFLKDYKYENIIEYKGKSNKSKGQLDFDLWFVGDKFYGDLKASDIDKKETPGNDSDSFFESLNKYGKFWFVIYEHETKKETEKLEATILRRKYLESINEWKEPKKHNREYNFHRPLKLSVNFQSMMIVELNRINCHEVLSIYNQGIQPDGKKRNTKIKINKSNLDNFVIYSYRES